MLKTCPSSSGLIENITNPVLENSVNTASSSLTGPTDVLLYKIMKCGVTWKKNDFSAHGGYPMEAISSEQSQKRPKKITWPRVSHPAHSRGQQHGTGHVTFMKLSQSFTEVWKTHSRNRLVAKEQQCLWPWKHTRSCFYLQFGSPECFLHAGCICKHVL